jgi:hypothetical protein
MSAHNSLVTINIDSLTDESLNTLDSVVNICVICNKKVIEEECLKLNFTDDINNDSAHVTENDLLISPDDDTTDNNLCLIVHKFCALKALQGNSNNSERWNSSSGSSTCNDSNDNYFRKYTTNIKKHWFYLMILIFAFVLIIFVSLYNCYCIIKAEKYLINNYDIVNYVDMSELFYDVHETLIINVLVFGIIGVLILIRMILTTFK